MSISLAMPALLSLGIACTAAADRPGDPAVDGGAPELSDGSPSPAVCGDGQVGRGEACDDGNTISGDGCSQFCLDEVDDEGSVFDPGHSLHGNLEPHDSDEAFTDTNEHGTFRIRCSFSHLNYDDAIVHPGVPDAAHLHTYFGSRDADAHLTPVNARDASSSTCQGDGLNLSSYWLPTILRPEYQRDASGDYVRDANGDPVPTGNYRPVLPGGFYEMDEHGVPRRDAQGQLIETSDVWSGVYYKRATEGEIHAMPIGLRMIAGDATATPQQSQAVETLHFSCHDEDVANGRDVAEGHRPYIPTCNQSPDPAQPYALLLSLAFPMCWDGTNLDSADHKSHMSYQQWNGATPTCPSSHPVALPQVSYQIVYRIDEHTTGPTGDTSDWFLSSDSYIADEIRRGGASAHGDWFMAWHPEVMDTWVRFCINEERHCAFGDLGNGFRMSTTLPGRGNPGGVPVINRGHGR